MYPKTEEEEKFDKMIKRGKNKDRFSGLGPLRTFGTCTLRVVSPTTPSPVPDPSLTERLWAVQNKRRPLETNR